MSADLSHSEREGLSETSSDEINRSDFIYLSEPEDYSMLESSIYQGDQTRLFWNLSHYPIPENADLVSIHRNIKLALHLMGVHGFLDMWAYGDKPNFDERDLYASCISRQQPIGGYMSIAGQMCVDILRFAKSSYADRTAFVVIAKRNEEMDELKRVLECLQSRYQNAVLIIDTTAQDDGLFQSVDSVFDRTQFVGGGKNRPRIPNSKFTKPIRKVETGIFWDAIDYPLPVGWSADTIYGRIKSDFTETYCVSGNMSILAYLDEEKKESSGEFLHDKTPESRIDFSYLAGDKGARHERMLHDILLWIVHHESTVNLIIVLDKIRKEFLDILARLEKERGYNVFIVIPTKDTGPESPEWRKMLLEEVYGCEYETET